MSLKCNVGGLDRALRILAGLVLLPAGVWLLNAHHGYGLVAAVLGLIGLVTGITGFCVLYVPFGISTASPASSPES
jgi:hypothetical protein